MTRPTGSAESTMNSETSFAADPVTTNTFLQPGDAVTFSTTHASRSASCRLHDQKIHGARSGANGARHDRTDLSEVRDLRQPQLDQACGKPKALPPGLTLDKPCPLEPPTDAQPK